MNIICFGDSITHARNFAEEDRWPTMLQVKLNEWDAGKYKIYNRGIGGHTSAQGYDRFDTDVLPFLPGVILVEFGFNDATARDWGGKSRIGLAEYADNMREFYRLAKANNSHCIFVINHSISAERDKEPQGNGKTYMQNFLPYNECLRKVVEELSAPSIDLPAIMQDREVDLDSFLSDDGLHLSVKGNRLYADMVFEKMKHILAEIA